MSLTGFQRYRRLQQIEEMRPENIDKIQDEEAKEKIGNEPTIEEVEEVKSEDEEETKPESEEKEEVKEVQAPKRGRRK